MTDHGTKLIFRLILLSWILLGLGLVPAAAAASLEDTTGPVVAPITEAAETAAPVVTEATAPVAPVVGAGAATAAPPTVKGPIVKTPVGKVDAPGEAASSPLPPPATATVEAAHSAARQTVAPAAPTVGATTTTAPVAPLPVTKGLAHSIPQTGEPAETAVGSQAREPATGGPGAGVASTGAGRPAPPDGKSVLGHDTFEAPSYNGSVNAPLGRLTAYVWPAVALSSPAVAGLIEGHGRASLLSGLYLMDGGPVTRRIAIAADAAGSTGAATERSSSGSSSPSRLPSALAHAFTSNAPWSILVVLGVIGLGGLALVTMVGWELGLLDRRRH